MHGLVAIRRLQHDIPGGTKIYTQFQACVALINRCHTKFWQQQSEVDLHFQKREILAQASPWPKRERKERAVLFRFIRDSETVRIKSVRIAPVPVCAVQQVG